MEWMENGQWKWKKQPTQKGLLDVSDPQREPSSGAKIKTIKSNLPALRRGEQKQ